LAFEILVVLAGLVIGWSKKGSIWNISNLRLRVLWMLPVPYVLQHISIFYLSGNLYETVLIVSYVLLTAFCLINLKTPGVIWAIVGTLANFAALLANGLRMPAYIPAVKAMAPQIVSSLEAGKYGKSIAMTVHTHLNFLGDIFGFDVWPQSLLSIGDILFSIGLIVLIQHAMRMRVGNEGLVDGRA